MALLPPQVTLASGEVVAGDSCRGIEVFPKQDAIGPDGSGNMVWLPWWSGAQGTANQFHQPDDAGELEPYVPEAFEAVTEAQVDAVLARLAPECSPGPKAEPDGRRGEEPTDDSGWPHCRWRRSTANG
jgi:hypothetical protein